MERESSRRRQHQAQNFKSDSRVGHMQTTQANQRSYRSQNPVLQLDTTKERFHGHTQPQLVLQQAIRYHDTKEGLRHEFKSSGEKKQSERVWCDSTSRNFHTNQQLHDTRPKSKASYEDHRRSSSQARSRHPSVPQGQLEVGNGLVFGDHRKTSRQFVQRQNFISLKETNLDENFDYIQAKTQQSGSRQNSLQDLQGRSNYQINRPESALGGRQSQISTTNDFMNPCRFNSTAQVSISNEKIKQTYGSSRAHANMNSHNSCINLSELKRDDQSGYLVAGDQSQNRLSQTTNPSRVNLLQKNSNYITQDHSSSKHLGASNITYHELASRQTLLDQSRQILKIQNRKENIEPTIYNSYIGKNSQPMRLSQMVNTDCTGLTAQQSHGNHVFSFSRNSLQPTLSFQRLNNNGQPTPQRKLSPSNTGCQSFYQSPNFPVLKSPGLLALSQNSQDQGASVPYGFVDQVFQSKDNELANVIQPGQFNSTQDSSQQNHGNVLDESKLTKLLNVFQAASLDLKTYSVTKIDSFEQVGELQKSLGIIAGYIDLSRREILDHVNLLHSDQAQTLLDLKHLNERKCYYKNKYRETKLHRTQSVSGHHCSQNTQNTVPSHRSRKKKKRIDSSRQSKRNQSDLPLQQPISKSNLNEGDQKTQSRMLLIEEVKDLTAKNAKMLQKFKEFQIGSTPEPQQCPLKTEQVVEQRQQTRVKEGIPLQISRLDDKQNKKDSIHQESESDRHRVRKNSNISRKNQNCKLGKRKLSSTIMNISKGNKMCLQDVNSSTQQIRRGSNQITSPDPINSFNVESMEPSEPNEPNIIFTQDEDCEAIMSEQLCSNTNQENNSRRQMMIFGSSAQQQFDEDAFKTSNDQFQNLAHFSRTTFTKNYTSKFEPQVFQNSTKNSSDYMDQTTKAEDYSSSGITNNLKLKTHSSIHDRKVRSLAKRESFDQKVDNAVSRGKQNQILLYGKQNPKSNHRQQRGNSSILIKHLAHQTMLSDIEHQEADISSQGTVYEVTPSSLPIAKENKKSQHTKTKSIVRRPQSKLR